MISMFFSWKFSVDEDSDERPEWDWLKKKR